MQNLVNASPVKPTPNHGAKITILKAGSLVRVKLAQFEGKLGLGVVSHFQVIYYDGGNPYIMVWVDMLIDGANRPFEAENLEVIPRIKGGFDQCFVADLLAA